MKKILTFALSLFLICGLFVSCSKKDRDKVINRNTELPGESGGVEIPAGVEQVPAYVDETEYIPSQHPDVQFSDS